MRRIVFALLLLLSRLSVAWADTHTWTGAEDFNWSNPNNWEEGVPPAAQEPGLRVIFPQLTFSQTLNVDVPGLDLEYLELTGDRTSTVELTLEGEAWALGGQLVIRRLGPGSKVTLANDLAVSRDSQWAIGGSPTIVVAGELAGAGNVSYQAGSGTLRFEGGAKAYTGRFEMAQIQLQLLADLPQASLVLTNNVYLSAPEAAPHIGSLTFQATGKDYRLVLKQGLVADDLIFARTVYWAPTLAGNVPGVDYPVITVRRQARLNQASVYPAGSGSGSYTLVRAEGAATIAGRFSQGASLEDGDVVGYGPFWQASYHAGAGHDFQMTMVTLPPAQNGISLGLYPASQTVATSQDIRLTSVTVVNGTRSYVGGGLLIGESRVGYLGFDAHVSGGLSIDAPGTYLVRCVYSRMTSAPVVVVVTNGPGFSPRPLPRWAPAGPSFTFYPGIRSFLPQADRVWFAGIFAPVNSEPGEIRLGWITPEGRMAHFPVPDSRNQSHSVLTRLVSTDDGTLWFGAIDAQFLWRHAPDGTTVKLDLGANSRTAGLTVGPDGVPWLIRVDGATDKAFLARLNPADASRSEFALPLSVNTASGLELGADQSFWFVTQSGMLGRAGTNGSVELIPLPKDIAAIPGKMTRARDGTLWLDTGFYRLLGYDTNRNWNSVTFPLLPYVNNVPLGDLAGAADGSVWCSLGDGVRLARVAPDQTVSLYQTFGGCDVLAAAKNGQLYMASGDQVCVADTDANPAGRSRTRTELTELRPGYLRNTSDLLGVTATVRSEDDSLPTGKVGLHDRGAPSPSIRLTNGVARGVCELDTGTTLTALYYGDELHYASHSLPLMLDVRTPSARDTSTRVGLVNVPVTAGQPFGLQLGVYWSGSFPQPLDGEVLVESDEALLFHAAAGPADTTVTLEQPGLYQLDVRYTGSENYDPSEAPPFFVEAVSPTRLTAAVTLTAAQLAEPTPTARLTAQVDRRLGRPGGIMQFYDGTNLVGTTLVENGTATLRLGGLLPGAHRFAAAYSGDLSFFPQSAPETVLTLVDPGTAGPSLKLVVVGSELEFSWPAAAVQFRLEAADVPSGGGWEAVAVTPVSVGQGFKARITRPPHDRFYRLSSQP